MIENELLLFEFLNPELRADYPTESRFPSVNIWNQTDPLEEGVESETGLDNFLRADTDRYKSATLTTLLPRFDRKDWTGGGGATIKITNGGEKRWWNGNER